MAVNQPPDRETGRLPVDLRPRRLILLPYNDLSIDQGMDQFLPIDPKGFSLTLGMVYGLGPNEPRVLRTDDAGNLGVGLTGAATVGARIQDGAGPQLATVASTGDGVMPNSGLWVNAFLGLFDGVGVTRAARMASAVNLAAQSGLGAALVAPPGQWSVQHSPATGAVATISKGAGGAGVRNICTGFSFGFSAGAAIVAASVIINLRDGASGAGGILQSWIYDLPAAVIAPFTVEETGFEIPGTAATAMTLEFTAALANLREFVNLSGHLAS